ncbi:response regulator, partial [Acinetobacter baumannii]
DDEPDLLSIMTQQLDLLGYRVMPAPDAETALAILRDPNNTIDLLISDIAMSPSVDGVSLVRAGRESHPRLPAILVSGSHPGMIDWEARLGPMPWVVEKPLLLGTLAHLIRSAL